MSEKHSCTLAPASCSEDWEALHDLRRTELFAGKDIIYNPHHPDDFAANHFPLVFKDQGECVGTTRLDLLGDGAAAIRLVAISKKYQRRGYGKILLELLEDRARSHGVSKLFVNARPTAIGYYERFGFRTEDWNDPCGPCVGIFKDCVPMAKNI